MTRFELYGYWRTSATFRVRVALALKGLAHDERFVDVDAGEHRQPAFLRLNPMGALPAFVDRGQPPLTQSMAILEFLEELQPEPPLLPRDLHARARVRSLCGMLAADTHPLVTPRVRQYLQGTHGLDAAQWKAWQTHWFRTGLAAFEQRLVHEPGSGRWCQGDAVGMADICLASIVAVMRVFGIATEATPTVDRIVAQCDALPAFADAAPHRQAGAPAA